MSQIPSNPIPNNAPERESDIGLDEAYTNNLKAVVDTGITRMQALLDQREDVSRRDREHYDEMRTQLATHTANLNKIALETISSAQVTNTRMLTQGVRHDGHQFDQLTTGEAEEGAVAAAVLNPAVLNAIKAVIVDVVAEMGIKPNQPSTGG